MWGSSINKAQVDIPLWIMFELTNVNKQPKIPLNLTFFFYLSLFELHVFGLYLAANFIRLGVFYNDWKFSSNYVITDLLSLVLWHSLLFQKKRLSRLVHALKTHKLWINKRSEKKSSVYIVLAAIYALPLILALLHVYSTHKGQQWDYLVFWKDNSEERYHFSVGVLATYTYYAVYVKYPLLVSFPMCVLIRQCELLLSQYKSCLKNYRKYIIFDKDHDILQKLYQILGVTHQLKDTLSFPLLISLTSSMFSLCQSITLLVHQDSAMLSIYAVELFSNALTGIFILFSLTLYCSRISENMSGIKKMAERLLDYHRCENWLEKKAFYLLEGIERKDVIYLSAYGMVDIKRSFLLPTLGTLLSYVVLVYSFA